MDVMRKFYRSSVAERLAYYCEPELNTGCLLWFGTTNWAGYGFLKVGKENIRSHRLAWEAANGPIPDGLHVLHRCDTPACVNPEHLFIGTPLDNGNDKAKKGRASKVKPSAVLTPDQVREIRRLCAARTKTQRQIARDYGVTQSAIMLIATGRTWKDVA